MLDMLDEDEKTDLLIQRLKKTDDNDKFLESLNKG
jgi:transcription termination factor Rho